MKTCINLVLSALAFFQFLPALSQDSTRVDPLKRKKIRTAIIFTAGYTGSMIALNEIWYKDFPRTSFHFFNDNQEWMQMDKVGHAYSAFYLSKAGGNWLMQNGTERKKAALFGAVTGFALLAPIEWLDGYSAAYGASPGDLLANMGGSLLYYFQARNQDDLPLTLKFSYESTPYPPLRPDVLGSDFKSELLKDYNGQTYWLSFDIQGLGVKKWPKWLHWAIGYSIDGMIYAREESNTAMGYHAVREFYLAPDLHLSALYQG